MAYDNPASQLASPNAIIKFIKDNGELATVASGVYSIQFRVCEWSCAVLPTDEVISTLDELKSFDPMSIVRYFPCYRITDAVGVSYFDASFKQQCACVCPAGMTLDGTTCKSKLASAGGKCAWNIDRPAGYTCSWSSASASALKLVSDCKVDVIVPADNYVADRRVNKYNSQTIPSDSRIEVVLSIEKVSLVDTWQQYLLQPQRELDNIEFRSFGVYNLTMRASNYDHQTSCDGCVAVVDTHLPHAVQLCATSSWG